MTYLAAPHWTQRFIFTLLPGATLVLLALFVIWGNKGLVRQMELKTELAQANTELADIQRDNQRMLRKLKAMQTDGRVMERIAGEELNMGVPGARIIRFADEETVP